MSDVTSVTVFETLVSRVKVMEALTTSVGEMVAVCVKEEERLNKVRRVEVAMSVSNVFVVPKIKVVPKMGVTSVRLSKALFTGDEVAEGLTV